MILYYVDHIFLGVIVYFMNFFFFWETTGNSEAYERLYAADLKLKAASSGTPLQYSCLENPRDGGAWQAAVHGIAEG